MRKLTSLVFAVLFLSAQFAFADWGKTGHRVVGEIATSYLNPEALAAINEILDNKSLALVSTYGDEIKSDSRYHKYSPWHYVNYPFGGEYSKRSKSPSGDLMVGIDKCIEVIKDPTSSKEDKAFYLKMLVHFIGDLHQPLHVGISDDLGGNRFQVQWFDEGTNLHSVWDTKLIEDYKMSYLELAQTKPYLTPDEVANIAQGDHYEWMVESRALCEEVYAETKVGANLKWEYSYRFMDTVRMQLHKGGIRLAMILNAVFA